MIGRVVPLIACVWLAGCAHNVGQDDHTGADGKEKGAKTITLENGEGKAKGIVTYPGGDRVDWKLRRAARSKRGHARRQAAVDAAAAGPPARVRRVRRVEHAGRADQEVEQEAAAARAAAPRRSTTRRASTSSASTRSAAATPARTSSRSTSSRSRRSIGVDCDEGRDSRSAEARRGAATPRSSCDEFTASIRRSRRAKRSARRRARRRAGRRARASAPIRPTRRTRRAGRRCRARSRPIAASRRARRARSRSAPTSTTPIRDNPNCDNATAPPVTGRVIKNGASQGSDSVITFRGRQRRRA